MQRNILVTSALPYANGSIHLGHLVEHIQTDIWVRFQRMRGERCLFICGDDAHGTPIMLSAEKLGITPEELIAKINLEHQQDFADFHISFDNFYTTHSPENREYSEYIYEQLNAHGDIEKKVILQAYDPIKNMFLPDRFIKGECPKCGAKDQYGDSCEVCGATYAPSELKNAVSVLSGEPPIEKESEHYFFRLEKYTAMLKEWVHGGHLQESMANKLNEWLETGLQPWDISRDFPYFGFKIPHTEDKFFYVWLDAPVGYMASLKELCDRDPRFIFEDYWGLDSTAELYHFIGKDIIYFHALFWPAILEGSGFRKPTGIFAHGFLTVNGQKMSKSRGTFIKARTYLDHLDAESLRYYFAAKLNSNVEDIDLNMEDFLLRVNSDLVGKVVNIASRCAGFIHKQFSGKLSENLVEPEMYARAVKLGEKIADLYEKREYSRAIREIIDLANSINQYIDEKKPWALAKEIGREHETHEICSLGLNLFRVLFTYLKPILPAMSEKVEVFLNVSDLTWSNRSEVLLNHTILPFVPLAKRIEQAQLDALAESAKEELIKT